MKFKAEAQFITCTALFSFALILAGPITFSIGKLNLLSLKTFILLGAFLVTAGWIYVRKEDKLTLLLSNFLFFSFIVILSDWPLRHQAVLEGLTYPLCTIAGISGLSFFLLLSESTAGSYFKWLPLAAALVFSFLFLKTLDFSLLFSDDHPTFLFRLITLKNSFPYVPSFNPLWNAGIEFRDFFASGALAIFLLFSPLIYFFDPAKIYNLIVCGLLFFMPVLTSYLTCRFLRLSRAVFVLNSLLAISSCTAWYRWGLSFGTLGFILATQILPFAAAFVLKLSENNVQFSKFETFVSLILISLMLLWPISVLFLFPLLVFCIFNLFTFAQKKMAWFFLAALLLINLPWMQSFREASKVESFLSNTKSTVKEETPINEPVKSHKVLARKTEGLRYYLNVLRLNAQGTNPLILFLALPGLLFLPGKKMRLIYSGTFAWLVLLATFGSSIKPQLELDRFLIAANYLLALPAAVMALEILKRSKSQLALYKVNYIIIAILLISGLTYVSRMLSNKTLNKFYPQSDIVKKLSSAVTKHSGGGRVLFSGFILHELSEGHIAPLVYYSGTPLIARSYKHDHWEFHEVVPGRYLKDRGKRLEEFFDLYNITSVISFDRKWRDFYKSRKELYKEVWHSEKFRIYSRLKAKNNYFLEGSGKFISQSADHAIINLTTPDAVIKFNYLPKIKVSGCKILPKPIEGPVILIELKDCPINTNLKMSY